MLIRACIIQITTVLHSFVKLLVGPDGGLAENEMNATIDRRFQAICLGPRVLRTETAALAAVLSAQLFWDDLAE